MYRIGFFLVLLTLWACSNAQKITPNNSETAYEMTYEDNYPQEGHGALQGKIVDVATGEPIFGARVMLVDTDLAAVSNLDGKFRIEKIPVGEYTVNIKMVAYGEVNLMNVPVQNRQTVKVAGAIGLESQSVELKPMIYLYPPETCLVDVQLDYEGEILYTYPKIDGSGWEVKADPDGTITDHNGRTYYGLFWEGQPEKPILPRRGTVVAKDSLIPFLESSLDQLGLNHKEANEFIVFWLPILEKSPYNLIYFAGTDYTDHAKLKIHPKPDQIIRVMMVTVSLDHPIDFPKQILPTKPTRKGFTVVEWGGTVCSLGDL